MASINSLNKIPFIPDMRITAEQLYEALKKMRYESKALGFIKSIPCPNAILDLLIENFKMNKKKKFIKAIHDNNCDLSSIQKICYINLKLEHLRFYTNKNRIVIGDTTNGRSSPGRKRTVHHSRRNTEI